MAWTWHSVCSGAQQCTAAHLLCVPRCSRGAPSLGPHRIFCLSVSSGANSPSMSKPARPRRDADLMRFALHGNQDSDYLDNINVGNLQGTLWYVQNEAW